MKNMIIAHNGSVQNIPTIPDDVKAIYKTVWEISQKKVLDLAADRGAFICQSQSLNVHLQSPTLGQLTSMHFYGWKKGLKTGMYYLRTRPAAQAIQFTVDQSVLDSAKQQTANANTARAAATANGKTVSRGPLSSRPAVRTPPAATRVVVKQEPVSPSPLKFDPVPSPSPSVSSPPTITPSSSGGSTVADTEESSISTSLATLSLDEKTLKAAESDPEFAAALLRKHERELEDAKLQCSLENKDACLMCSG
jgi:ribonucleoside-diphosphate reductase subunit M1